MFKTIGQVARYKPVSKLGMEELAARQKTVVPSGGVLFARNTDGEEKAKARDLVLNLFTREKWDRPLNMLTMPGLYWRFERKLLALRDPGWTRRSSPRGTHFTGVENDRSIYFAGVTQMPGVETPNRLIKPVKRGRYPFAEIAIKSRFASYFFANVDDFMHHQWVKPVYHDTNGWDAAWLDYTGPLSVERLNAIKHFYENYIREVLVVTVLKARWNKETNHAIEKAGGHSAWLKAHLPGTVEHDIEYFDTSPMAQFAIRK